MLDSNAIKSSIPVVQALAEKSVNLIPINNTPLAMIVRETPVIGLDAAKTSFESLESSLIELSRDPGHADLFATAVNNGTAGVRFTVDYSRNVVMPHVSRVIDAYITAMEAASVVPMPYTFDVVYQPEVFLSQAGRDFIGRWESTAAASSPGAQKLGEYTADEIIELAHLTSSGEFNADMEDLLKAAGGKGLGEIVEVLAGNRDVSQISREYSLPLSIVLMNIEHPKDGVEMTLTRYNAVRIAMANVAGRMAASVVARSDIAAKQFNVYYSLFDREENKVELCGEVYRDLLDKGLTVEMLVGNELLGRKFRGPMLLNADAQIEMKAAYERDKAVRADAHLLDRARQSRAAILNVLRDDQQKIAAEGEWIIEGDDKDKSWQRLKTTVDSIMSSIHQHQEPTSIIAAVICVVWYAHTDACRMIDIMLSVEKQHPGLPAMELATLATLHYICYWVASQITVEQSA